MGFDADFLDDMPTTITIAPWLAGDAYSKPAFGAPVSIRCRLESGNRKIVNFAGQDVISMNRLFLAGPFSISVKDQITMPAGIVPLIPPILRVDQVYDEDGPHHTVVYC